MKPTNPPCPVCRTARHVVSHDGDGFFCGKCRGMFDADPDEGGDYFSDPSKRLERSEERKGANHARRPTR